VDNISVNVLVDKLRDVLICINVKILYQSIGANVTTECLTCVAVGMVSLLKFLQKKSKLYLFTAMATHLTYL